MYETLFQTFILQIFFGNVYAQNIVGCGGFVKSDVHINFERVKVKLYTSQGALKSTTECAPNNGYFLVAIYDNGDYILRIDPPEGWSFDPQEIKLAIDGVNDPCSQGKDLNFMFTGFTVVGQVISLNKDQGPSTVIVNLHSKDGSVVATDNTDDVGKFKFSNIKPNDYIVKAAHPTWKFKNDEASVKVLNDNSIVDNKIVIAGFDVKGHVLSGGEPIQGVSFVLLSKDVDKKDITHCEKVSDDILNSIKIEDNEKVLCTVVSQKNGAFVFPTIPSGTYMLIPFYTSQNIVFDILPQKLSFSVNYKSVEFKTPFQVYGFSVQGKVVDKESQGIQGAVIRAVGTGGEERKAISGIDGKYLLENVTTGHYVFKMEKDHYFFTDEKVHITPNTPKLKDILVKEYHLCGSVDVVNIPPGVLPVSQHRVLLQPEGGQNTAIKTTSPDQNGRFCFKVEPGTYKLEVPLTEDEKKLGFLLKPSHHVINVKSSPLLDLKFTQFLAVVKGSLRCIEPCTDVAVHLTHITQPSEKNYAQIENIGAEIHFTFVNILPGKYKITPQRKKWCWNPSNVEVEVKDLDVSNVKLQHSGYYLKCVISHNITLNFKLDDKEETVGSFELKKGSNQFCLKTAGRYSLMPKSCYRFEKETYFYNTNEPSTLTLTVESYKIVTKITTTKKVTDLQLTIRSLSSNHIETITPTLTNEESQSGFVYEALHWGGLSEEFTMTPISKEILFYPETDTVLVKENCPGATAEFKGHEGIFIEGQISPPFPAVSITITLKRNEKHAEKTIDVLTDMAGYYRVGPVHSDIQYDVAASKEGYHITPQPDRKGSFIAQKLAHITVKVVDETLNGMGSVLLSLSGGQFRNNNLTQADGTFTFSNLGPGQYFLRPMQKEYSFTPNSKMIELLEGEDLVEQIEGRRVAYSCSGSLTTLSGSPEERIGVEAVGLHKCSEYHESAISDHHGHYRLRGLQPGCSYNVRLIKSAENMHIERFAPTNQVVQVPKNDVTNVDFIVFTKPTKFHVTAQIDTELDLLPTIRVLLYDEENMESPLHTINPGAVTFIHFPPLKPKTYVIKLQSTLSSNTHELRSTSATISPDEHLSKRHVKLKFEAKERSIDMEPTQSVIALPLAVAFVFLAYNYDTVLVILLKLNSFIQNFNKTESSDAESDQDEETSKISRKKRR